MADDGCKLKLEVPDPVAALKAGKDMTERCGCRVVSLMYKPKDGFQTVTVVCLRGRVKKAEVPVPGGP